MSVLCKTSTSKEGPYNWERKVGSSIGPPPPSKTLWSHNYNPICFCKPVSGTNATPNPCALDLSAPTSASPFASDFSPQTQVAGNSAMGISFVRFNHRENRRSPAMFYRKEIAHLGAVPHGAKFAGSGRNRCCNRREAHDFGALSSLDHHVDPVKHHSRWTTSHN